MSTTIVYKILLLEQAEAYDHSGAFDGAPIDHTDGYIHLSAAHQVAETLSKYFADKGPLVLVGLDPERMPEDALRWEVSRGGALFPHLYGKMSKDMEVVRHMVSGTDDLPEALKGPKS